jgi:hypothetical protein
VATIEDALAHIAVCLPPEQALVLWESAAGLERLAPEALRAIRWPSRAAALAAEVTGWPTPVSRCWCVVLAAAARARASTGLSRGRPVDVLVGEWLVIQIDGWAHHSSSTQRSKDISHDAELRLRGYTVLRFSYAQVVHDAAAVERAIRRALAAGLHDRPFACSPVRVTSRPTRHPCRRGGRAGPGLRHSRDGVASG